MFVQPLLLWNSLRNSACYGHVHYCYLWPAPLYGFPHYFLNGTIKKKLLNIKYEFRASLQLLSVTHFILRRTERDVIENVYWFSSALPFILVQF